VIREDPQTGDARCGQCGCPEDLPPLVGGGQGRSAEDVEADGRLWGAVLAWGVVGLGIAALVAMVRG